MCTAARLAEAETACRVPHAPCVVVVRHAPRVWLLGLALGFIRAQPNPFRPP